jgi:hypothetical protein
LKFCLDGSYKLPNGTLVDISKDVLFAQKNTQTFIPADCKNMLKKISNRWQTLKNQDEIKKEYKFETIIEIVEETSLIGAA